LGNVSREIEKQNYTLEKKINFINDQIRTNEIEFSLYHNYGYLKKLHKVYFDGEQFESFSNKRLSFVDIQKNNFKNIYTVGTQ
jgi:Leucine-rich repeat (LRR) protein